MILLIDLNGEEMTDEICMQRCIELAEHGLGKTAPNPLVGSVVRYDNEIIGEGFHRQYGKPHAEVNAIAAVKQTALLEKSTLYVNLEPCSHHGKTPPCVDLILEKRIPKVVIGTTDPFHKVSGNGIKKLKENGVEVIVGVLEKACKHLNRRFFTFHNELRPYVILKWAQSMDGFIAPKAENNDSKWMTGDSAKQLVHKWRSEEPAILVGTNTAIDDNPQLTVRAWSGNNPLRIVLDRELRIPETAHLLDGSTPTLVFTSKWKKSSSMLRYETIDFSKNTCTQLLDQLAAMNVQSVLVEGGKQLLDSFLREGLWDEARVFIANLQLGDGLMAPHFNLTPAAKERLGNDQLFLQFNPAHH
jgi:diaminohydroxyphosphoribosylaminopyrimidine deaminase/5-amino-6-(5-phosphoribosylamino)uracil reductase